MSKLLDVNLNTILELKKMSEQTGTDLYEKLVGIFLSETPLRIAAIQKAWANKNYKELGAAAHALKSGAAYLGADKLTFLAAQVEDNCSKMIYSFDFAASISQMGESFNAAKAALEADHDYSSNAA